MPWRDSDESESAIDTGETAIAAEDGQALVETEADRRTGDGDAQRVDDLTELDRPRLDEAAEQPLQRRFIEAMLEAEIELIRRLRPDPVVISLIPPVSPST